MLLHHKVYQEPPVNYTVFIAFAWDFVLENFKIDTTTQKSPAKKKDWERKPIAWAMFAKEVVANVIQKSNLAQKVGRQVETGQWGYTCSGTTSTQCKA